MTPLTLKREMGWGDVRVHVKRGWGEVGWGDVVTSCEGPFQVEVFRGTKRHKLRGDKRRSDQLGCRNREKKRVIEMFNTG